MAGDLGRMQAAGNRTVENSHAVLQLERHGRWLSRRSQLERWQQIVEVRRSQMDVQLLPQRPSEIEARSWKLQEGISKIDGSVSPVVAGINHTFNRGASRGG